MKNLSLLISPEARAAYFGETLEVAQKELELCFDSLKADVRHVGGMDFLDIPEGDPQILSRMSFVQGIFQRENNMLRPIDVCPDWGLHGDFVFGSKFKGKTNERLTQMLINLGLALIEKPASHAVLLDPMCGRATTLLWAMRYGMKAWGVDEDVNAIGDVTRNIRKWAKLTRTKHQFEGGFLGKKNKKGVGAYLDFRAGGASMRMAQGDARMLGQIYRKQRFDLIVSDLPYGVQHTSGVDRNPLNVLKECAVEWRGSLAEGGCLILAYNRNNPKRKALQGVFEDAGWDVSDITMAHRMSESIVRDVLVARLT